MSVSSLLADLGYDAGRINGEMNNIELSIESFDPWAGRQNLAVTTLCNCVQYPTARPGLA